MKEVRKQSSRTFKATRLAKVKGTKKTLGLEQSSRIKQELIHDNKDTYNLLIAVARWSEYYGYPLGIYRPDPIGCDIIPDALLWSENAHSMAIFAMSTEEEYNNFKYNVYPHIKDCVGHLIMVVALHGMLQITDFPDLLLCELSTNRHKSNAKKWLGHFTIRGTDDKGRANWYEIDEDTELWLPDLENRNPLIEVTTLFLSFSMFALTAGKLKTRYYIRRQEEEAVKTFPQRYKISKVAEQFMATKEYIRYATRTFKE